MFVITGGAGFVGSYLAAALEADGHEIAVIDWLGSGDHKWRNVAKRRLIDLVVPEEGLRFIEGAINRIEGVFHFGAISTTTETDVDAIVSRNIRYSLDLWALCAKYGIPLVYASSAATYGDGAHGFEDRSDEDYLSRLRPLNPYGWSKHLFDRMTCAAVLRGDPAPPLWAGLKFFNVFGPNEYHKANQRSVAVQLFEQVRGDRRVRLFRSERSDYAHGEQKRDFVWVGDCIDVARWLMNATSELSGLYNVGSGCARSFRDKAEFTFRRLGVEPAIDFVDMPAQLKGKYQYHTEADIGKLRRAGYNRPMLTLEEGLDLYFGEFLLKEDPYC